MQKEHLGVDHRSIPQSQPSSLATADAAAAPSTGSSPPPLLPTISSQLKREEQRIDLKVLHHKQLDDNRKKQKRFARTVLAVHAIVSQKLYKTKANSLEAYFRDAWKISRAQVYRFLDCAVILKQLEKFSEQPCRERLCRSLKRVAKNRADIHALWAAVLEKVNNEHESVTSTIINNVWRELLDAKLVTGNPPTRDERVEIEAEVGGLSDLELEVAGGIGDDCDSEQGEMHDNSRQPPRAEFFSDQSGAANHAYRPSSTLLSGGNGIAYVPPTLNSPLLPGNQQQISSMNTTQPDDIVSTCLSLVNSLESHGLALQPFLNGRWVREPITEWRVVRETEIEKPTPHWQGGARKYSESYDDFTSSGGPYGRDVRQQQPQPPFYPQHQPPHLARPGTAGSGFQPHILSDRNMPGSNDPYGTSNLFTSPSPSRYDRFAGAPHSKPAGPPPLHPLHTQYQPLPLRVPGSGLQAFETSRLSPSSASAAFMTPSGYLADSNAAAGDPGDSIQY
ncbi:hypothetical protein HDU88_000707 [Geranomyces variabilis]|nr:hypothetical protein HDU88_000707 [Geranomyces variabilis]